MSNSNSNPNRSWITDKRITPPHLKGFTPKFRKSWKNMMKEFNSISPLYKKHKETQPLLRAIREVKLFKDIIGFNPSVLRPINSNVVVSFRYKETIVYKSSPQTKYVETHSHSLVSTYSTYKNVVDDFIVNLIALNIALSPIVSYKAVIVSKLDLTPTTLPITQPTTEEEVYDDFLEDYLDLDMNGGISLNIVDNEEEYDEDYVTFQKELVYSLSLDDSYYIPTTDKYDRGINRCVYDYLQGYYSDMKLTYYSLYKIFHGVDRLNNLVNFSDKVSMWVKDTGRDYNEEIRNHNLKIDKSRIKYGKMKDEEVKQYLLDHPKQQKEHDLLFTHKSPTFLEVCKWIIPNKYLEDIVDKGLWGVSIRMLLKFCDRYNIPMYALNQNNKCVKTFVPKIHSGYKSLCFKMVMGHFYGIDCSSTIYKIAQVNSQNKSSLFAGIKDNKALEIIAEQEVVEEKVIEIESKQGEDGLDILIKKMVENNIIVSNKNIIMKDKNVVGFKIDNDNYRLVDKGQEKNWGKELDIINEKEWDGEHIIQKTTKIFKELCDKHVSDFNDQTLSFFNLDGIKNRVHLGLIDNEDRSEVKEILSKLSYDIEGVEDKNFIDYEEVIHPIVEENKNEYIETEDLGYFMMDTPQGKIKVSSHKKDKVSVKVVNKLDNYYDTDYKVVIKHDVIKHDVINPEIVTRRKYYNCYDINKCYSSILNKPLEEWIVYDFKDVWVEYEQDLENEGVQKGLYVIKTNDTTLFHSTNIYSSAIVNYGLNEGIINHKSIKYQLISHNTLTKNYFEPFIQRCLNESKNNKGVSKTMINLITGICGKTQSKHSTINITKEMSEMVSFLQEEANTNPFIYTRELNDDKVFFYGNEKVSNLQEHSLPIYIQILDQSNIKLYEMIKDCGENASCIYRKTDCIIVESSSDINLKLGENWGEYSREHYPRIVIDNNYHSRTEKGLDMLNKIDKAMEIKWNKINILDSNEYEEIYKATRENKGFMLLGRAGTGKSYAINKINDIMKGENKRMQKIAFTNTASLNIGGTTIHKFLQLNKTGHLMYDRISQIKKSVDLIVIDEISMVSSFLWYRLYQLQDKTGIPFLLVGDFRQIPPVEDMIYEDYREHPTLKLLGGYTYCELETIHRYDDELAEITKDLEGMNHIKKSQFQKKIGKVNICYTNKTRKRINQLINSKTNKGNILSPRMKSEDKQVKKGNEMVNENPTQDIYLYDNLPMISRITHGEEMVNNERFIITKITKDMVMLESERPDEDGIPYSHIIGVKLIELQKYFLCAYCVTTHKSQGITINGALTIHDWDLMDKKLRYTAITRAKKLSNIYMI